jgi:hypothetical protein
MVSNQLIAKINVGVHGFQALWSVVVMGVIIASMVVKGSASGAARFMFALVSTIPTIRKDRVTAEEWRLTVWCDAVLVECSSFDIPYHVAAIQPDAELCASVLAVRDQCHLCGLWSGFVERLESVGLTGGRFSGSRRSSRCPCTPIRG